METMRGGGQRRWAVVYSGGGRKRERRVRKLSTVVDGVEATVVYKMEGE